MKKLRPILRIFISLTFVAMVASFSLIRGVAVFGMLSGLLFISILQLATNMSIAELGRRFAALHGWRLLIVSVGVLGITFLSLFSLFWLLKTAK